MPPAPASIHCHLNTIWRFTTLYSYFLTPTYSTSIVYYSNHYHLLLKTILSSKLFFFLAPPARPALAAAEKLAIFHLFIKHFLHQFLIQCPTELLPHWFEELCNFLI